MPPLRSLFAARRSAHKIAELRQRIDTLEDAFPFNTSSRETLERALYRTMAEMAAVRYAHNLPDRPVRPSTH